MPVQTRRSLCQKRKAVEDGAVVVNIARSMINVQFVMNHYSSNISFTSGHSFHTGCIERQLQAGSLVKSMCFM